MKRVTFVAVLGAVALALALIGLGGEGREAQAAPAAATTVQVELKEFSITANPASVPAGDVQFVASNTGTMDHEMVIIKTDLAPDAIPVVDNKASEDAPGVQVVDEIAEFEAGTQQTKTVNLEAGNYVLICNIPGHYQSGMRVAFTVTGAAATATPSPAPGTTSVQVDIKEFSVTANPSTVPAGEVQFVVSNTRHHGARAGDRQDRPGSGRHTSGRQQGK